MNKWELRYYKAFGDGQFHRVDVGGQEIAFVYMHELAEFLRLQETTFVRFLDRIYATQASPKTVKKTSTGIINVKTGERLLRWFELDALEHVIPSYLHCTMRIRAIKKWLYYMEEGHDFERRFETLAQQQARIAREERAFKRHMKQADHAFAQYKQEHPERSIAIYDTLDRAFTRMAHTFEHPALREGAQICPSFVDAIPNQNVGEKLWK